MPLRRLLSGLLLAFCAALAAIASAPAQAQVSPTRGMSTSRTAENVNALRELGAFGACMARFHRATALEFIAREPGSREEQEYFQRAVGGERVDCYGRGGSWTNASLIYWRGVIAEGLLNQQAPLPANLMLSSPTVDQVRDLDDVARCYVSNHRNEARTVLATRLGSPEETAAIGAIWGELRACFPAGLNVRLNAPWIRFLLAEALLRTGTAPRPLAGN